MVLDRLGDLSRRKRLVVRYLFGLGGLILLYTLAYNYGMRTLEGEQHSLFRSFQTVVETMTTTGYGADSPWATPIMNLYMVLMQVSGIVIGLATLRVLIIPLWKRTPVTLDERLTPKSGHVVVCEYRRDSGVLLDELERLDIDYVLVDSDADEAKRLSDDGYQAIHGDPERRDVLERASIRDAAMVVADAGDRNVSVILTARELNPDAKLIALTESRSQKRALTGLGVGRVLSPHAIVGRRLARKATIPIPGFNGVGERPEEPNGSADGVRLGEETLISELLIRRGSPLHGMRLDETRLWRHSDLDVAAGWFDGQLRIPPDPSERLTPNTVLVVAGSEEAIADVRPDVSGLRRPRAHSTVVVAGLGEGGSAAREALPSDVTATTIDDDEAREPDVVGDATDAETLTAAGIEDASALIVTVGDDAAALLTVALARTLTDDLEIFARVTETTKVANAFTAGADYVLSVQRVSARLLAREIYGEDVLTPVGQIRTVRVEAAPFAGESLADVMREDESGSAVLGVSRDGTFLTDGSTELRESDTLVVVGSDDTIREFERT